MKIKNIVILPILSLIIILTLNAFSYAENIKQLKIDVEYKFNKSTNTVTAIMHSNNQLANTKPTWTLSEDKFTYSKVFDSNMTYSTPAQDIYGNIVNVELKIVQVLIPEINVEYKVNPDGNITAIMKSNMELKNTKPTWVLSEDKLNYTKTFNEDITYTTPVETIYGNIIVVKIEIKKPALKITMNYEYNKKNNTVTAIMQSNLELKNTKPTWTLSSDKSNYTKIFDENMIYSTPVEDIYGNIVNVRIEITKLIPKITLNYNYNANNTSVIITIKSNTEMKNTKPTWTLSSDKSNYTKTFDENMIYLTPVEDVYGNVANVKIEITKLLPKITMEYIKNSNNTVTAIIHSNCELADTKPTWTLSNDKLTYTKTFNSTQYYTTPVQDIYGNEVIVRISIKIYDGTIGDITSLSGSNYYEFQEKLNVIKEKYPNWNIKLLYTGLDWNTVIDNEDAFSGGSPKSLIHESYGPGWAKGTQRYDVSQDWLRATKTAIRYMMDPRNSLTEQWIFQFQDLSSSAGERSEIKKMVAGTFMDKDSIIDAIIKAARTQGISPFHIVSRIKQEQGADGSGTMNGHFQYLGKTVYNLYNINVSGNTSVGLLAGARYAYDNEWYTPEASIIGGAEFLAKNYIEVGQSTLYFQKFNVVVKPLYDHQYMQNIRAANDEGNIIYNAYKKSDILNSHFEFLIPVYENMPQSACPRP